MNLISQVIDRMIQYYKGDPRRINHFLKVYGYAKTIGELEGLDLHGQEVLEIAAAVHDIGIKVSEEKYGSSAGSYQEKEGPPVAGALLEDLGAESSLADRVCYLVGHHHTYGDIDGMDYQILVEADFLVNMDEDNMSEEAIASIRQKIFQTETGKAILDRLFG